MRKMCRELSVLFCIAVFFLCGCQVAEGGRLPKGFDEQQVREKAELAVNWFNEQEYEKIIGAGSVEFKELYSEEDIAEEGTDRLKKCGAFREIEKTAVISETSYKSGEGYGGLVLIGAYENGKIEFRILFDEEMNIVQFLLR